MKRKTITLGILLVLSCRAAAGEKAKPFEPRAEEAKIFELTNEERKKKDAAPLKLNPALSKIARAHSENMAKQGKTTHTLDDKDFDDRVREAGYKFSALAENVGSGGNGASLEMIMKAWMDSEGHRTNLLNTDYSESGVGLARDEAGRIYVTQIFAQPRR